MDRRQGSREGAPPRRRDRPTDDRGRGAPRRWSRFHRRRGARQAALGSGRRPRCHPGAAGGAAPGELELGAYVNVAVHPDRVAAAELCRGSVAIFARFATEGARASGLSDVTRRGIEQLASGYRHDEHGESATPYAQRLDIDFIERFAVAGPAEQVRERLAAIADLGITRLIVVPGSLVADPAAIEESNARFAEAVLPDLRG